MSKRKVVVKYYTRKVEIVDARTNETLLGPTGRHWTQENAEKRARKEVKKNNWLIVAEGWF